MRRVRGAGRGDGAALARARVLLAGVLLLGGCGPVDGTGPGGPPTGDGATAVIGEIAGFPSCAEVPQIRAEDAVYRDEPVYGNAEELRQEVHEWAAEQPGFVEIALDRERNGWLTIGVKDAAADALQEDVAQRWPGEGIMLVEVPWTTAELDAVRTEVETAMRAAGVRTAGSALFPHHGVAEISLGVVSPDAEHVLAGFTGRPLCVTGLPAEQAPEEKEQPTAGAGWRLLGEGLTGEPYRTAVATTGDQLRALWRSAGLHGAPAEVDWEREIAVWFGAVYGSGCPVRLDGVVVDGDLVHADLVVPGAVYGCPDDANPHAFVVAVSRDLLPRGPFQVQLEAPAPHPGTPDERTVVDVDLAGPGSTATDEQAHADPAAAPPVVVHGDDLPANQQVRYVYRANTSCGTPVVGPLGGSMWRLTDGEAPWDVTDGDELLLNPLGDREMVASARHMDWPLVRLGDGRACP